MFKKFVFSILLTSCCSMILLADGRPGTGFYSPGGKNGHNAPNGNLGGKGGNGGSGFYSPGGDGGNSSNHAKGGNGGNGGSGFYSPLLKMSLLYATVLILMKDS